jgi:PIN domain nuclease of toxin-antitoxin system
VLLWWDARDPQLQEDHRDAVASPSNDVFVSAATVWEIAIKRSLGKLKFAGSANNAVVRHGFQPLVITFEHAEWAGSMTALHRDPFDRMLVAQSKLEGLILVTVDPQILRYPVPHL